jgi:hypothetical protein
VFVIDLLIEIGGNDPDVKPVYSTDRVQHGWVVPSFHTQIAPRTRTRARPLGRARGTIDPAIAPWRERQQANNNQTHIYTVADEIRDSSTALLTLRKNFLCACGYGMWIR